MIAPKTVAMLIKAARVYPKWKAENSPAIKPWIFPEQNKLAPLNVSDVRTSPDVEITAADEEEQQQVSDEAPPISDLIDTLPGVGRDDVIIDGESEVVSIETGEREIINEEAIVPQSVPESGKRSLPIT